MNLCYSVGSSCFLFYYNPLSLVSSNMLLVGHLLRKLDVKMSVSRQDRRTRTIRSWIFLPKTGFPATRVHLTNSKSLEPKNRLLVALLHLVVTFISLAAASKQGWFRTVITHISSSDFTFPKQASC